MNKEKIICIYKITSPTGKIYIGQSRNIERRKIQYLKCYCYGQTKLYHSLLKYGFNSHEFEILETCHSSISKNELDELEYKYFKSYKDSGVEMLNLKEAKGSRGQLSEESRLKISKNRKGKLCGKDHPLFGVGHSQESKDKMSKSRIGKYAGARNPNYGKPRSEEVKAKISIANTGRKKTPEQLIKMSEVMLGEKSPSSILKTDQVIEIKNLFKENLPIKAIANRFNIKPCTIYDIRLGRSWKHVNI